MIERRAADVLVLGSGPVAYSAAYSLAKSGQKVGEYDANCSMLHAACKGGRVILTAREAINVITS